MTAPASLAKAPAPADPIAEIAAAAVLAAAVPLASPHAATQASAAVDKVLTRFTAALEHCASDADAEDDPAAHRYAAELRALAAELGTASVDLFYALIAASNRIRSHEQATGETL